MDNINKVFKKENTQHNPDEHTDPIKLTNKALNPFKAWTDFYGEDGEAVITFITMQNHLFEEWTTQATSVGYTNNNVGKLATINGAPTNGDDSTVVYSHLEFENNFEGPGIYQDDTHYHDDDKVDESYTVILPHDFMTREMCEKYLEKLNEEYNRKFYIEDVDYKEKLANFVKNELENDEDLDFEDITTEDVIKIMEHTIV